MTNVLSKRKTTDIRRQRCVTIMVVDNHIQRLSELEDSLRGCYPNDEIAAFSDPMLAIKYCFNHSVDAVFTDINLQPFDGRKLAEGICVKNKDTRVYFITEAIAGIDSTCASGFLIRPVTKETIKDILENIHIGGRE